MPFLKPFMPQTHTVPGFRLGPNLPRLWAWRRLHVRCGLFFFFFVFVYFFIFFFFFFTRHTVSLRYGRTSLPAAPTTAERLAAPSASSHSPPRRFSSPPHARESPEVAAG